MACVDDNKIDMHLMKWSKDFKKVVVHCPVTLSVTSYWNIKMALIAAHLNAGIILMVTG